jgi:hypothetical protein
LAGRKEHTVTHSRRLTIFTGKAERTREVVLQGMKDVQKAFAEHDLIANVRLETYEPDRYLHVPPTK